ncbi:MAG TPA: hypothetical protein VIK91_15785 [Nannocystis sp.]
MTQTPTIPSRWSQRAMALAMFGAISVAGCDDSAEQRKPGPTPALPGAEQAAPAPTSKTSPGASSTPTPATSPAPAAEPSPPAPTDIAGVIRSYSGCYTDCFTERASATNRETCKLNCDAAAEASAESIPGASLESLKAATASFTSCVNACYADKSLSATNRATCVLTCQDAAEVAASSPPGK